VNCRTPAAPQFQTSAEAGSDAGKGAPEDTCTLTGSLKGNNFSLKEKLLSLKEKMFSSEEKQISLKEKVFSLKENGSSSVT
jgi:hypothetical protein